MKTHRLGSLPAAFGRALWLALLTPSLAFATVYDANDLTVVDSTGDGVIVTSNAGANNGNMRIYMADGRSDYITFNVNVATAGTYDVAVRYHLNPNRGSIQLKINGVERGNAFDLYHPSGAFGTYELGSVTLPAGNVPFSFVSVDHNESASEYRVAIDTITLTPSTARTDITTFATITDALNSGVPLYAPPGTYTLPFSYTPIADIDILGDLDPAYRPVFEVQNPSFLASNYSIKFQGIAFIGSAGGKKLLSITTQTFDMPNYTLLDCTFSSCTPIFWPTFPAITGQVLRNLEMRRFALADANRGIFAAGRVDNYDITDFTVDDCGRFGVCIGPAGKGINPTITSYMKRGLVARGVITGTRIEDVNNSQLDLAGHQVVVEDIDLHDMVLPAAYHTDPSKEFSYPADSEPFYTKVEVITVNNLYIQNDGAYQAMWGLKGASGYEDYASGQVSPQGRDATATNLTFVNTGERYCVGIWFQTHGDNTFTDVAFHGRTNDAMIIHQDSATGSATIQNWTEVDPPSATSFPGVKNKSLNNVSPAPAPVDVTIINSPTLTEYAP